ncbi:hypothetical protein, partial [Prevotella sp. MGM2]|uniref:hypothetical protein n=1 Tax=Prevotella sp. MGM2 TaxID=2033406 RepID=UPI000D0C07A1
EKNPIEYASKTQKKRDFLMESPASLSQRYNILSPKANSVKIRLRHTFHEICEVRSTDKKYGTA